jgi:molecular chaperone GrpE
MKDERKGPPKIDLDDFLSEEASSEAAEHVVQELEVVGLEPPAGAEECAPEADAAPEGADVQEMEARHMRLRADFENYRKRVEREKSDYSRQAAAALMLDLLPVLDNLERALQEAEPGAGAFSQGVALIHRQAMEVLQRAGLEAIQAAGELFDPECHEAVERHLSEDHPDGTVVDELQKGYLFQGKLLRPAMVRVAFQPEARQAGGTESED